MQIAIFSDVHGNLPALKAVLKDINNRKIKQKFCLGDLVDFAPWGNEVINVIRRENIPCIMGNHDERVAFNYPTIPLKKHTKEESQARKIAIEHSRKTISKSNKKFLSELPFSIELKYKKGKKFWKLILIHASLENNETYLYENKDNDILKKMLDETKADIILMGHTHISYIKEINTKCVVNCGSVGRSKQENGIAYYAIVTIKEDILFSEIIKIAYPLEETIQAIRESDIPEFYATFLQKK